MSVTCIIKQYISYGLVALLFVCSAVSTEAASPREAEAILKDYELSSQLWLSEMKLAPDDAARRMIMQKRPDPAGYADQMKKLISRDLANEWTLKYGAWLLENDPALSPGSQRALLNAVEKHHVNSPEVGSFCLAMTNLKDRQVMQGEVNKGSVRARGIDLLEKIKKTNPNVEVQGQAALAISIMLSSLGDDGRIMKRRISNIKEAVIKSADVKVGDLILKDIINDELYKITNLSKGRQAPDFKGLDSARRPIGLSDYKGKVVMLVFWSAWDADSIKVLDILKKTQEERVAKPFAILGVNRDDFMTLRRVEAESMINWKNVSDPQKEILQKYRISATPYCLVLDQDGVIRYSGNVGSFAGAVADDLLRPEVLNQ